MDYIFITKFYNAKLNLVSTRNQIILLILGIQEIMCQFNRNYRVIIEWKMLI